MQFCSLKWVFIKKNVWLPRIHCPWLPIMQQSTFVCQQHQHHPTPSLSSLHLSPTLSIFSALGPGSILARLAKDSSPFSLPAWLLCSRPQGSLQCNWLGIAPHDMSICKTCPSPTRKNNIPLTTEHAGRQHKGREGESILERKREKRHTERQRDKKEIGYW